MKLRIISPGNRMPAWVQDAYQDYAGRITPPFSLTLCELPALKRTAHTDLARLTAAEGEKILAAIHPAHRVVALDEHGDRWTTQKLADQLTQWQTQVPGMDFLIGGTDGLSPACLKRADCRFSLSALTLPHPMVRIILAEQLYRATTILRNHPYHRG